MKFIGIILILGGLGGIINGYVFLGLLFLFSGVFIFRKSNSGKIVEKEIKEELTFRVAGVTKEGRQNLIKEIVNDWKELYPDDVYEGLTNKEILENDEEVYEVDIYGYDEISLVPEPDNPYDPNAIKVIHEDVGIIGYVPKELTSKVRTFLDNDCELEWTIVGGKKKYVDWDEEKVKIETLTYGVEISLWY